MDSGRARAPDQRRQPPGDRPLLRCADLHRSRARQRSAERRARGRALNAAERARPHAARRGRSRCYPAAAAVQRPRADVDRHLSDPADDRPALHRRTRPHGREDCQRRPRDPREPPLFRRHLGPLAGTDPQRERARSTSSAASSPRSPAPHPQAFIDQWKATRAVREPPLLRRRRLRLRRRHERPGRGEPADRRPPDRLSVPLLRRPGHVRARAVGPAGVRHQQGRRRQLRHVPRLAPGAADLAGPAISATCSTAPRPTWRCGSGPTACRPPRCLPCAGPSRAAGIGSLRGSASSPVDTLYAAGQPLVRPGTSIPLLRERRRARWPAVFAAAVGPARARSPLGCPAGYRGRPAAVTLLAGAGGCGVLARRRRGAALRRGSSPAA